MIKTILIIIVSVAIFGLIVFVLVRNALRRKIDQLVEEEKKSNKHILKENYDRFFGDKKWNN